MAIEFRCVQCQKQLRVSDDAVGKKARCPQCGTIQDAVQQPGSDLISPVSFPAAPSSGRHDPGPKLSSATNPFSDSARQDSPFSHQAHNPYIAPSTGYAPVVPTRESIRIKLQTPATVLQVIAIIAAVIQGCGVVVMFVALAAGAVPMAETVVNLMLAAAGLAVTVVTGIGAQKMKNLENYPLAITAAALAALPCTSTCCIITIPIGIWALVLLIDPQVKNAFQ
jgi:hypothetical protein